MNPARPIDLDANILIRFVLGEKVPALLAAHAATIDFLAPDTAFEEARSHLPTSLRARGVDDTGQAAGLAALEAVTDVITVVPASETREIGRWWPARCSSAALCPVWTEDKDFYGIGVATWPIALVELYFSEGQAEH